MKPRTKAAATLLAGFLLVCTIAYALDGIVFEEKAADPFSGTQVGLYAGDTAGANEAWWRRDDGSKVDLSAGGGGSVLLNSETADDVVTNVTSTVQDSFSYTLPAGTVAAGDVIVVEADFTGSVNTDGETMRLLVGGVEVGNIVDWIVSGNPTLRAEITIRATSGAGSARYKSLGIEADPGTAAVNGVQGSGALATDWTSAVIFKLTLEDAVDNGGTCTVHQMRIEHKPAP